MTCERCQTPMLSIPPLRHLVGHDGDSGGCARAHCPAWRCIACGNYVDPVIRSNRGLMAAGAVKPLRLPGKHGGRHIDGFWQRRVQEQEVWR